jgi:hypothetical protein
VYRQAALSGTKLGRVPSRALVEAAVVNAVEAVLSGGSVEDDRIECKSELMRPDRVRQLAGAANAALGEDLIWVVGIDEKAKILTPLENQSVDVADWWAQVEAAFDGAIAPDLMHLWVPVTGGRVLALHFTTDRAPYVVKSPGGGIMQEGYARRTCRQPKQELSKPCT